MSRFASNSFFILAMIALAGAMVCWAFAERASFPEYAIDLLYGAGSCTFIGLVFGSLAEIVDAIKGAKRESVANVSEMGGGAGIGVKGS